MNPAERLKALAARDETPAAREPADLPTALFQACGGRILRLLPETSASQVKFPDGMNAEARINALERALREPGPKGDPGRDGRDGKDGEQGPPGRDGADGKDGEQGPPGRDGADGKDGRDGEQGPPGRDGADGKDGRDGEQGPPGRDGADGRDGRDGADAPLATAASDGLMSAADKAKLDGLAGEDYVSKAGGETINGIKVFADVIAGKTQAIDINKNPSSWIERNWFSGNHKDDGALLTLRSSRNVNGDEYSLFSFNKDSSGKSRNASISVVVPRDGNPYAIAPSPANDAFGNEIVTAGHARDTFINRLQSTTLYVGGANAADRDPRSGWGFSADKPFATFSYAKAVLMTHYVYNGLVGLVLQDDLTWGDLYPWLLCANMGLLSICSASASDIRTLTFNSTLNILSGQVQFSNIRLNYPRGSGAAIQVNGGYRGSAPTLLLGSGCVFSGACSVVVQSIYNGAVFVQGNLAGDISGQRYACTGGSKIITNGRGPEAIPGTAAGYCDSTSIYS